jgi:hypothetical protein
VDMRIVVIGLEAGNAAQVTKVVELELTNWGSARVGIPCK